METQELEQDATFPTTKAPPPPPMCLACGDSKAHAQDLLTLRCDCTFCSACLARLFTRALSDESLYPPSCHRNPIPLSRATRQHLPSSLVRSYRLKSLEMNTKRKLYCAKKECSAFIGAWSVHNGLAYCQAQGCRGVTCVRCKEEEHFGGCDEMHGVLGLEKGLAEREKWRGCPGCGRLVEKVDGCNHILCRCGTDFCYACGLLLDKCRCADEDEADAVDWANIDRMWLARRDFMQRRPRTPNFRELEEDIIEDTMVAPFDLAEDEFSDDW